MGTSIMLVICSIVVIILVILFIVHFTKDDYIYKHRSKLNSPWSVRITDTEQGQVTIATFNIHCIPKFSCSIGHLRSVGQYIKKLVARHKIDVFIFTEVFIPRALQAVREALQSVGSWKTSTPNFTALRVPSGVVIAWDTATVRRAQWQDVSPNLPNKLIPVKHIVYRRCCQFDCLSLKGAIHMPLVRKKNGRVFHVIGTHLQAWEIPYICKDVRVSQMLALGDFCTKLKKQFPDDPIFSGGDFNVPPETKLWGEVIAPKEPTYEKEILDYFYLIQHGGKKPQAHVTSVLPSPSDHVAVYMNVFV